jgi:hypothetical protein
MSDIDLGEMFLNFPLDAKLRPYAGIDLSAFPVQGRQDTQERPGVCWERWERCLMGFKPSPYNATRAFGWCEEFIRGDGTEKDNPLQWDQIRMNLPGEENYDPTLAWLSKTVHAGDKERIAGDFSAYVDDIRVWGVSDTHCWEVSRRIASRCQYLGIQDAPRKRRAPSRTPGAWAGSNVVISTEGIAVTVSQERWDKTKGIISKWASRLEGKDDLNRKELESDVGFLIYVTRSYPAMKPYLKGFHLTLHGWRPGRDEFGWKNLLAQDDPDPDYFDVDYAPTSDSTEPVLVRPVPRLLQDVRALDTLTSSTTPPLRLVRPNKVNSVRYGFGDASGSGFGSTFDEKLAVLYRHGIWGADGEGTSSNWRELTNLVEALESEAGESRLQGCEVFMFTDNSTAESAFFRGTSSSELLFNLVLRLRKLELDHQCLIHIVHVAGTRMIGQGSDGLSRGNLTEGVMTGQSMLSYVPLGKTALERTPSLLTWIRSWAGERLEVLTPKDWFLRGQGLDSFAIDSKGRNVASYRTGIFLWCPPPVVADVAAEEMRRSRHKRETSFHVFVCPRLMTNLWRKLVLKEVDFYFEVPVGSSVWGSHMHEPLLIGVCLPFIAHRPWKLGHTPKLLGLARELRHVWESPDGDPRTILRQLFELPGRLSTMSPKLVRSMLYSVPGGQVSCSYTEG